MAARFQSNGRGYITCDTNSLKIALISWHNAFKMNAKEPLFISEGICHLLGILGYHPDVKPREVTNRDQPGTEGTVRVHTVRVKAKPDYCG